MADDIVVTAVGDIMLGSTYPDASSLPPQDGKNLLKFAAPILQKSDIAFGNLEGPLTDSGVTKKTGDHSFAFRVPTRYGRHLKDAGFTVFSLANNHASDFGPSGRQSTRATLEALGIAHAGSEENDVAHLTVKGLRVVVLAFGFGGVTRNLNDISGAQKFVAAARKNVDMVIVSFHGGAEGEGFQHVPKRGPEIFQGESRGDERRFAHAVIDAGAALALGHGPHVVRGMEIYQNRLIAYSLGNFATYGRFRLDGAQGLTLILEAHLNPQTGAFTGGHIYPMIQPGEGGPRPDPKAQILPIVRSLSKTDFGPAAIRVAKDGTLSAPPPKG